MANKILLSFLVVDALFLVSGALLLAFPLINNAAMNAPPDTETIARNLLLERCPMTGSSPPASSLLVNRPTD